ncbi:MAG: trehalase, partial [Lewinella sp.]|nr:trehalase [Lewinella sp.]
TRSQPPFFASMVNLLAGIRDSQIYVRYLPELQAEYDFWMAGEDELSADRPAVNHVVQLPDGAILNRYYDQGDYPRAESYREDVETAKAAGGDAPTIYRHLRSGAESGWDFSSRWFADEQNLATIHTTDIIPVDLNALLYNLELTLATAYAEQGDAEAAATMQQRAQARLAAVQAYCWDEAEGFFRDYDFVAGGFTPVLSMAAVYPLAYEMVQPAQAARVAELIERDFLQPGGLLSTLNHTGQQWDAPNGWAPLQWMAYRGLKNYGHDELANNIRDRWIANCIRVYENTGKLVEKYNVEDLSLEAGGGEYPVQDGFGWTNGVLQRFMLESQE